MSFFSKLFLFFCGVFVAVGLSGCWERKSTYLYLMCHPEYLQRVYNQCVAEVADPALPCQTIMQAQSDFTSLVNQRAQDPERFGAQVLQAEENAVFFQAKFTAAWKAYRKLGATSPGLEDFKALRIQADKARLEYIKSRERVLILLSVISATSSM